MKTAGFRQDHVEGEERNLSQLEYFMRLQTASSVKEYKPLVTSLPLMKRV